MKRLIFTLCLLLSWCASGQLLTNFYPGVALWPGVNVTQPYGGTAACSKGDTTNIWDVFLEGFTSSGFDSNSIVTVTIGSGTITTNADSSSLTSGKPPGNCDTAMRVGMTNDATYVTFNVADIDLDAVQTVLTANIYLEAVTNGANFGLIGYRSSSSPAAFGIGISMTGTTPRFSSTGAAGNDVINVEFGKWYTVEMSFDTAQAADGSSMKVFYGGSQVGATSQFQRGAATDINYLFVGAPINAGAAENGVVYFDCISIKTNE